MYNNNDAYYNIYACTSSKKKRIVYLHLELLKVEKTPMQD